ncbi:hypothetical protein Tco_0994898, partial [Tanacetum coccineum]
MTYPPLQLEGLPFELEWDLLPNYTIRSSNSFEWRKIIFGVIIGRSSTKLGQRSGKVKTHVLPLCQGFPAKVEIVKVKALGARGVMKGSSLGVVWIMLCGGIEKARVMSRVVVMIVLLMLRGISEMVLDGFRSEEMVKSVVRGDSEEPESDGVGVGRRESSEKHSIRKSHVATLGHAYHSVSDVIGKIEGFLN